MKRWAVALMLCVAVPALCFAAGNGSTSGTVTVKPDPVVSGNFRVFDSKGNLTETMTPFEKYSLLINSVFAFLTFVAVIIAIWGEKFRQLWTKPKLTIADDEPSFTKTNAGIKGWYYLIRVSNVRPSSPAQNVRILLTNVYRKGPDGSWQEQTFSGPTQVKWRWPEHTPPYATVGPDELSTFGYLLEHANSFELQLYWYPNNLKPTILSSEPTRLVFKAVSDTVESNSLALEVAWDGGWADGREEMKNHLVVKRVIA